MKIEKKTFEFVFSRASRVSHPNLCQMPSYLFDRNCACVIVMCVRSCWYWPVREQRRTWLGVRASFWQCGLREEKRGET